MKSITTVVQDVYDLLSSGKRIPEEQVDELGKSLTDMLKRRLSQKQEPRGLSMSSVGTKCKRQLWYKVNKPELAEALSGQQVLNFLFGDIIDTLGPYLVKWTKKHDVTGEQTKMEFDGITGSRDLVIDGVTVDIKTANSKSIEKFKNHRLEEDDPFGYIDQITGYVAAAGADEDVTVKGSGSFLVFDKERGGLYLDTYRVDTGRYQQAVDEAKRVVAAPEPPARRYSAIPDGKSGNMTLPFQCAYCSHKKECWKDANGGLGLRKFIYSTGPRWLTRVLREPDVPEVKDV
jgi:hypothetical protein